MGAQLPLQKAAREAWDIYIYISKAQERREVLPALLRAVTHTHWVGGGEGDSSEKKVY